MIGAKNLTDTPQWQRDTVNGMPAFSGTGPKGSVCGLCDHWGRRDRESRSVIGDFPCLKLQRLTGKKKTEPVPGSTPGCKHFAEHIVRPRWA
jgi:hypothetical protein